MDFLANQDFRFYLLHDPFGQIVGMGLAFLAVCLFVAAIVQSARYGVNPGQVAATGVILAMCSLALTRTDWHRKQVPVLRAGSKAQIEEVSSAIRALVDRNCDQEIKQIVAVFRRDGDLRYGVAVWARDQIDDCLHRPRVTVRPDQVQDVGAVDDALQQAAASKSR